jgi:hypothetical protein
MGDDPPDHQPHRRGQLSLELARRVVIPDGRQPGEEEGYPRPQRIPEIAQTSEPTLWMSPDLLCEYTSFRIQDALREHREGHHADDECQAPEAVPVDLLRLPSDHCGDKQGWQGHRDQPAEVSPQYRQGALAPTKMVLRDPVGPA